MGSLSDYAELELLDHVFNAAYSAVSTVYLGLSTADPQDDGSGLAEPSGNGYIRKAITFGAAATRKVTQSGAVTFDKATGSWGTITHWAVFDAESAGNMLAHGALNESKDVVADNTPSVDDGSVYVQIDANEVGTACVHKLLDLMFRNQAYAAPDTYVAAIITTEVTDSDTGATITEPSGNGYARKQVNVNGGSSPTWDVAAAGLVDNTHDIDMPTATGSWGTIIAVAVVSSASGDGDVLWYDNAMADQAVGNGDTMRFPVGDLDATLS